jgi:hypothetical protein
MILQQAQFDYAKSMQDQEESYIQTEENDDCFDEMCDGAGEELGDLLGADNNVLSQIE